MATADKRTVDTGPVDDQVVLEAITMGLYLSIVLLSLLIGFGGDGTRAEELQLLWGTSLGLLLAHFFALRLTRVLARARPLPTREDARAAGWLAVSALVVTGTASVPYLLDIDTLEASSLASVLLLGIIGGTAFVTVRRAGGATRRALAFTVVVVAIAAVVVMIKYTLTH